MRRFVLRSTCVALIVLLASLSVDIVSVGGTTSKANDASAVASPTYVSELAPPLSNYGGGTLRAPNSGGNDEEGIPLVYLVGTALALLGTGLIYAGLSGRQART